MQKDPCVENDLGKILPKISKLRLKQELYRDDPWKMLVCCIMLNQTHYKQFEKIEKIFFDTYPDPSSIVSENNDALVKMLRPLGLYNRRAKTLKNFSKAWLNKSKDSDIINLPGVGKYAYDSWKMFQEGIIAGTDPTDKALLKYKKLFI